MARLRESRVWPCKTRPYGRTNLRYVSALWCQDKKQHEYSSRDLLSSVKRTTHCQVNSHLLSSVSNGCGQFIMFDHMHMHMCMYMNVKIPCMGHRFLTILPDMTCVLPVGGILGHYLDRCINVPSRPEVKFLHLPMSGFYLG